jgi:hypothetical protein
MTDFNEQDIERLSAYLDGMLNEAERLELEALLRSADSPYHSELDSLQNTVNLVKALPTLKAPRSFALTREMAGLPPSVSPAPLEAKRPVRAKQINFYAMSFLSAAASFIMVVLAMVLWTSSSDRPHSGRPQQAQMDSVASIPTVVLPTRFEEIVVEPIVGSGGSGANGNEGLLLGAVVGNTAPPLLDDSEIDNIELDNADESLDIFSAAPIPFPQTEEGEAVEEFLMESADMPEDESAGQAMLRSVAPPESEQSQEEIIGIPYAVAPPSDEPVIAIAGTMADETDSEIAEATVIEEPLQDETVTEIAIEETASAEETTPETTATASQTDETRSGLPTVAVVLLIIGGLFALMAVTGIYWARKIQA